MNVPGMCVGCFVILNPSIMKLPKLFALDETTLLRHHETPMYNQMLADLYIEMLCLHTRTIYFHVIKSKISQAESSHPKP